MEQYDKQYPQYGFAQHKVWAAMACIIRHPRPRHTSYNTARAIYLMLRVYLGHYSAGNEGGGGIWNNPCSHLSFLARH